MSVFSSYKFFIYGKQLIQGGKGEVSITNHESSFSSNHESRIYIMVFHEFRQLRVALGYKLTDNALIQALFSLVTGLFLSKSRVTRNPFTTL